MTTKTILGLASGLAMLLGTVAHAETTWKMATKMPVDSPEGQVFQKFAELTEELLTAGADQQQAIAALNCGRWLFAPLSTSSNAATT